MNRKGSYNSKTFLQRICKYYNSSNGLLSDAALCLASDRKGTVYIATPAGLNFTKADGSLEVFECGEISSIFVSEKDDMFFAVNNVLYLIKNKTISEFQVFNSAIKDISGKDKIYLLTAENLYVLDNGKFTDAYCHNSINGFCLACDNSSIMASDGRALCIAQGKRRHWMTVIPEHSTMPNFKINCITFDNDLSLLWLGTDKGAYIFDCKYNWFGPNEINALPEEEIYKISFADDGRVIFSSDVGVIILKNGLRKYLPAERWAFESKINDAIAVSDSIWTATDSGVTEIIEIPMTLREKADYCFKLTEDKYVRLPGFVAGIIDITDNDINTGKPQISDNDGLWTQMYVGALSYAYAVTGDAEMLKAARRSMRAAAYLTKVSGIKGFTARAVRFNDEKEQEIPEWAKSEWHRSPDGKCMWRGETSSDEMTGHFFGFSLYYDLCADDDDEKEYIKTILCDIVDHILDNGYRLCDVDGEPTTWAVWDPEQLNRNNMWLWEKCINSLEMLTFLSVAYHVSGNEKYRKEFMRLAIDEHYLLNASQHKKEDAHVCHIDDILGILCMATILRTEKDLTIRKYLLMGLKHHWEYERPEHRAIFNLIYGAFTDDVCDLEVAVKNLREFPLDFVERPMYNSSRRGLQYDTEQEKWNEAPQLKEALDIDARPIRNCDCNPFHPDDGQEGRAAVPTTFLLPYWIGRYYGLIEE